MEKIVRRSGISQQCFHIASKFNACVVSRLYCFVLVQCVSSFTYLVGQLYVLFEPFCSVDTVPLFTVFTVFVSVLKNKIFIHSIPGCTRVCPINAQLPRLWLNRYILLHNPHIISFRTLFNRLRLDTPALSVRGIWMSSKTWFLERVSLSNRLT